MFAWSPLDFIMTPLRLPTYPLLLIRWRRTAACALINGLAPENFAWLAQYFLGQLVGWGLAPPEETDSEVMALVAPAGDKGRATLQKLHRRISNSSFDEVSRHFAGLCTGFKPWVLTGRGLLWCSQFSCGGSATLGQEMRLQCPHPFLRRTSNCGLNACEWRPPSSPGMIGVGTKGSLALTPWWLDDHHRVCGVKTFQFMW